MPLVRCPTHGRVYDSDKDAGCPLCLQGVPGAAAAKVPAEADEAAAAGRKIMLVVGVVVVLIGGGGYWWFTRPTPQDRAQVARDSLRAVAAGPARPDTSRFAAANDLSPIRHARALKASLEGILAGRGPLMAFAEGPIDTAATDRAEQRRVRAYLDFARRWHGRLDAAARGGTDFQYGPGVQYGPQMENVTNQLQAALSVMRDMVRPTAVKPRAERTADAKAAAGYLHAAGTVLTNLPR